MKKPREAVVVAVELGALASFIVAGAFAGIVGSLVVLGGGLLFVAWRLQR